MSHPTDQLHEHRPLLLSGDTVGLALMQSDDVAAFARWHQNLDFTARMGFPGDAQTIELRRQLFEQGSRVKFDSAEFAVIELASGRVVGFGGLFDINRALVGNMFVGIGENDCRKKGYGTEAARLICEYGFFFRSLHSIRVEVHSYNPEAVRVYERLGFKRAGKWRGALLMNGRRYDEVMMDLLRDEFELKYLGSFKSLAQ